MKRRSINVFSLSFIDCICCGLGAIILLFVIVNAKGAVRRDTVTSDLRAEVSKIEKEVLEGQKKLIEVRNSLQETTREIVKTEGLSRRLIETIKAKEVELAQYDNDTLASKEHVNRLKADLKSIEEDVKRLKAGSKAKEDGGAKLRSFPGQGDRQYLTDLKIGGKRIFFLVDASASMLDDTIVGIIRRRNLSDRQKKRSVKWQQTVKTIDWLTTQMPPTSRFQIYTFNETAKPLVAGSGGQWLDGSDVDMLDKAVSQMRKVVPANGTSLINAFNAIKKMSPPPDNIFLLTDGLPTMGTGEAWRKKVSGKKRLSLFNDAVRMLSGRTPVNIILYPMEGDPMASSAFWRLAVSTNGSYFCPSKDWP